MLSVRQIKLYIQYILRSDHKPPGRWRRGRGDPGWGGKMYRPNFMFEFPCIISLYYIKNQQDATLADIVY